MHAPQQRELREPAQRTHDEPEAPDPDVQEGPHDLLVEVGPRAAHQLRSRLGDGHRGLVRAVGGHDVEGVDHRHDSPGPRDLAPREASGIPRAVPAFVVIANGPCPLAQPRSERSGQRPPLVGVGLHGLPFARGQWARLVQELCGNRQLPDVVEQGRPLEFRALLLGQAELLRDECRIGPRPFRVAPRQTVVTAEFPHQREKGLRRLLGCLG